MLLTPVRSSGGTASPLTTKGDLYGYDTQNARIPVGPDGTVITADSTEGAGVAWKYPEVSGTYAYFWTPTASDVATYYKELDTPYDPLNTATFSSVTNGTLLRTYVTEPSNPSLTYIPGGQYHCHIHCNVVTTSGKKSAQLRAEIWEVSATGVDIAKIGDLGPSEALSAVLSERVIGYARARYTLAGTTSRIATKIYAVVSGSGGDPDIQIAVGDGADSNMSFTSPSITVNNFVPYTGASGDVDLATHNLKVADEAFGASWEGSVQVPTKNAVYDKIKTIVDVVSYTYFGGF
jgi:hypothetical protein